MPPRPPFHARPDLSTAARTTDELEAYPDQVFTDSRCNMKPRSVLESGEISGGLVYMLLVGLSRVGILKADRACNRVLCAQYDYSDAHEIRRRYSCGGMDAA